MRDGFENKPKQADDLECAAVLSVEGVGAVLRLKKTAVYSAIARGDIPALRIGRRLVIPRAALEKLLANPPSLTEQKRRKKLMREEKV